MIDTEEVAFITAEPDWVQRWTAKRKAAAAMSIVNGGTCATEAARKHRRTIARVEGMQEQFFAGGESAMRSPGRRRGGEGLEDREAAAQHQRARARHRQAHGKKPQRSLGVRLSHRLGNSVR